MIPTSKYSAGAFVVGGIVLLLGGLIATIGTQIKSRHAERHRNRLYVLEIRGEQLPSEDPPPRVALVLQYVGMGVAFVGVVVLVAAWTSLPGQN
jgi:hypothetical protein